MPLITLIPTTKAAEKYLKAETSGLQPKIEELVTTMCGVPAADVIIRAVRCTILIGDPKDASVHMRLENNPNEKIEWASNLVRDRIVALWKEHFRKSKTYAEKGEKGYPTLEIWKQFILGSWGLSLTLEGELLTESFEHVVQLSLETLKKGAKAMVEEYDLGDPPERDHLSDEEFAGLEQEAIERHNSLEHRTNLRHLIECDDCQAKAIALGLYTQGDFDEDF